MHVAELLSTDNMREVVDTLWDYRAKWKLIGVALGVNIGTLEAIDADYRRVEDTLPQLVAVWLRGTDPRPTRTALTMALKSKPLTVEVTSDQGK